jgi:hypothetical protein
MRFLILVILSISSALHAVEIPENAKLNYSGNDWECHKGFYKSGSQCHSVEIPENAKLNYSGNDWECHKGFYKSGGQCHSVEIPENAKLNYSGNDWECQKRFIKTATSCVVMTASEIKEQIELERAVAARMLQQSAECSNAIESQIDGEFSGWEGETLFKLTNGQIWQQSSYDYTYSYAYMPEVLIFSSNGMCKMKVDDVSDSIYVQRLK